MRLWRRRASEPEPEPEPEFEFADRRRWTVVRCAACKAPRPPYRYLENGKDYCETCAVVIRIELGIRDAGRRRDDNRVVSPQNEAPAHLAQAHTQKDRPAGRPL